jgi:hypothetical protein
VGAGFPVFRLISIEINIADQSLARIFFKKKFFKKKNICEIYTIIIFFCLKIFENDLKNG